MTRISSRRKSSGPCAIMPTLFLVCFVVLLYMSVSLQQNTVDSSLGMPSEGEQAEPSYRDRSAESSYRDNSAESSFRDNSPEERQISVVAESKERDFLEIALKTGTDKVLGKKNLPICLGEGKERGPCPGKDAKNKFCRPRGHFYHTMYNRYLGSYSRDDAAPFQFLEIGYYNGRGFDAYLEFLPKGELHSMEISCLEKGPREEGKWPWGNFAEKNKRYQELLDRHRLHCGDASDVNYLNKIWLTEMKRKEAPPLKVVIDDASHIAAHMVQSVFFWFPRIEPRGILVVEDVQPSREANKFRTQFLPQIMADLHYCGGSSFPDEACFPTLQPLLASIHCEMHICVFERNDEPSVELDLSQSKTPANALDLTKCGALKN